MTGTDGAYGYEPVARLVGMAPVRSPWTGRALAAEVLDKTACLVVVTEVETGAVVSMNKTAEELSGYALSDVIGEPLWANLIAPGDRAKVRECYEDRTGVSIPLASECTLLTKSGEERRVVWSCALLDETAGARAFAVMTGIEIPDDSASGGLFSHLLGTAASSTVGCIATDLQGRVTFWSIAAEQMLGYSRAEMIGQLLRLDLFDPEELQTRAARSGRPPDLRLLAEAHGRDTRPSRGLADVDLQTCHVHSSPDVAAAAHETYETTWRMVRQDGVQLVVATTISSITDSRGDHIGFFGLGRDVTREHRTNELLADALRREAEASEVFHRLDRAKDAFVATVSHELRTPLTSIDGYTELLEDCTDDELGPRQRAHVDAIRRNTDRLALLVENLLSLSSTEQERFDRVYPPIDLRDAVAEASRRLSLLILDRGLAMTLLLPRVPVIVRGDAEQLTRAVLNLLSNAVKFTEDKGAIECALTTSPARAILTVTDNGFGIPVEEQGELFTRFFRSSTSQQQEKQGSGLGLAVVAAVVRGHGGEISVVSEHLGGARFTVDLPLLQVTDVSQTTSEARPGAEGHRRQGHAGNIKPASTRAITPDVAVFLQHALTGEIDIVRDMVVRMVHAGVPRHQVVTDLLVPAQVEVGERWARNGLSVADEHLATGCVESALHALSDGSPEPCATSVVLVCPEAEQHAIAAHMFAVQLRSRGVRVRLLGGSAPAGEVAKLLEQQRPDALLISCTMPTSYVGVRRDIDAAHALGLPVLVGGAAFENGEERVNRLGGDAWATDVDSALAILHEWRERPPCVEAQSPPLPGAALQLAQQAEDLSASAHLMLAGRHQSTAAPGADARAPSRERLTAIVRSLAAAQLVHRDQLFIDFLLWSADQQAAHGFPLEGLRDELEALVPFLHSFPASYLDLLRHGVDLLVDSDTPTVTTTAPWTGPLDPHLR